jgi:predicted PurR-regulated permease PerM
LQIAGRCFLGTTRRKQTEQCRISAEYILALDIKKERFQLQVANGNRANGNSGSNTFLTVLIVIAALYFARTVFVPLALAVLLVFILAPLVARLQHWGFGRIPSVASVVLLFLLIIGVVGALMSSQLADLAHKLPEYQTNVHRKIESIRSSGSGLINRMTRTVDNLTEGLTSQPPTGTREQKGEEKPVPVEIRHSPFSPLEILQKILGSFLNLVVTAAIVLVFVIFMLIERTDLRDRVIRLGGASRVNATTRMLDDASERVSRYLLRQLIVNAAYGILAGLSLYIISVPNPFLWGLVAALLRYVPYLGIWIAAAMPAAVAFAVEPGWAKVPLVFGLYFGIDLVMYNFVEPLIYGSSTGLSALAILVSAVFWTWLWGPVGLLLSTPMTVCVVVLGRHIPHLWFLRTLLSDEPVLSPEARLYQRLLAMDLEEATEIAEEFLKCKSLEEFYDGVVIPTLSLAEADRHRGRLDEARQRFLFQNTRIMVEDLAERAEELSRKRPTAEQKQVTNVKAAADLPLTLICIPARDEADEIAALMLVQLLNRRGVGGYVLSASTLAVDSLDAVSRANPPVACVLAVPPFGYVHARYLCRRLRMQMPELKIVGAILTEKPPEELEQRRPSLMADELASSLQVALTKVLSLALAQPEPLQPIPTKT